MSSVRERTNATDRLFRFLNGIVEHNKNLPTHFIEIEQAAGQIIGTSKARADFETMSAVWSMLLASEGEITQYLPKETNFYLRNFEDIISLLGPRTSTVPWNQHQSKVRERYISDIEHAAQRLRSLIPEVSLNDEELTDAQRELDSLIAEIDGASLTAATRSTLLYRCSNLRRALDDYHLTGAPGIQRAFDTFLGSQPSNYPLSAELKSHEGSRLMAGLQKVILVIVSLLGSANTIHDAYKNFAEPIEQFFLVEPPSSHDPEVPQVPAPPGRHSSSNQNSI